MKNPCMDFQHWSHKIKSKTTASVPHVDWIIWIHQGDILSRGKWSILLCQFIHIAWKLSLRINFTLALKRWLVMKARGRKKMSGVSITQNSSDVLIVRCLISFILFIIPEVIMSWILEAAILLSPQHGAPTLNGVIVIIAFMHGKVHFLR